MSQELISQYADASREFQKIVSGISSGDLLRAPKAGEWSAGFVVHHMADAEVQFATRFMNALAEVEPSIVHLMKRLIQTHLIMQSEVSKSLKILVQQLAPSLFLY